MIIESALEIVAKKLVDIFGNRAELILKKDKARAASYEAYYSLRRIERIFHEIERMLRRSFFVDSSKPEYELFDRLKTNLRPFVNELAAELASLRDSFGKFDGKMEIYQSLADASEIRLYIGLDDTVMGALFNDNNFSDVDIISLTTHMRTASALAREAVASFIRDNYKADQRDDGM
jgi:hypothetical protein